MKRKFIVEITTDWDDELDDLSPEIVIDDTLEIKCKGATYKFLREIKGSTVELPAWIIIARKFPIWMNAQFSIFSRRKTAKQYSEVRNMHKSRVVKATIIYEV